MIVRPAATSPVELVDLLRRAAIALDAACHVCAPGVSTREAGEIVARLFAVANELAAEIHAA